MLTQPEQHELIVEAVGEMEAERLIICEFGSINATFDHLAAIGSIEI